MEAVAHLNRVGDELIEVHNPVSREVIGTVPNLRHEAVEQAVRRARTAQAEWAVVPVKERSQIIKRFANLMIAQQQPIIDIIQRETGKAYAVAYGEVMVVVLYADFYSRHAPRWLKPDKRPSVFSILYNVKVYHHPYGVVGNIAPWNYPLLLSGIDMIPALLAGNAVVVKPSEITPFSIMEMARVLREAGLPDNVFQVVTGNGETGAALVDHVDYVMFTGSTATGRKIAIQAAERLIPCSLELGSNNPMIVLKDANINKAAAGALRGCIENTGQACVSTQRVIVEAPIYDSFLKAIEKWYKKIKIGSESSFDFHMSSLTNQREFDRTLRHTRDALDKGARLLMGSKPIPEKGPLFLEPVIITDARPDMEVMQEETFGPMIAIIKAKDADEAVQIANSTQYGLAASVWSKNKQNAEAVATRLEFGTVNINTLFMEFGAPTADMAGWKNSGIGARNGKQGLMKYTQPQSIIRDNFPYPSLTAYTSLLKRLFELSRKIKRLAP